ncbi:MAG: di-heme oxidoredictase family protein [Pseudomonadota bacterium]
MRRIFLTLAALIAGPVLGAQPGDPHLNPVPRTDEEVARIARAVEPTTDFSNPEAFEANSAGAATVRPGVLARAFSGRSSTIDLERGLDFEVGHGLFEKLWVSSPSSTLASDGLGPVYNARSCERCHVNAGRGHPPESTRDSNVSMLVRLSIPAGGSEEDDAIKGDLNALPEPNYGWQLQDLSIAGMPAEGRFSIAYEEIPISLSDGETATLRKPSYTLTNLAHGPLHPKAMLSPRVAQQMIGLGLLDAIPAADILAQADPEDADGNGISGRAQFVRSREFGTLMLGRFGHKAGQPSLREQTASAFHGDIGISSTLFPEGYGDCTPSQARCRAAPDGNTDIHDNAEIGDEALDLVLFYTANLAVPARRNVGDPSVLHGKRVFYETGCIHCHTPKFVTHRIPDRPEHSFQLIWPYSDLLLHDMGPGLADNRPEAVANGREWRTPPLWGIGLTQQVSGHTYFLHDGRARSLLEAVLWHGGEAETQRQRVVEMPKSDRDALVKFLESL